MYFRSLSGRGVFYDRRIGPFSLNFVKPITKAINSLLKMLYLLFQVANLL